jgi:CheY-like chemotaxis protein
MGRVSAAPATVLLVEDDALFRMLIADTLAAAGFEVEEANNSDEALARLSRRDGSLDALITDVEMPGGGMNGAGLAWRVHDLFPEAAILVVSGVMRPRPEELPAKARFLPKPVTPEFLIKALESALSSGKGHEAE